MTADRDELAEVLHADHCGCGDFQAHADEEQDPAYHAMADAVLGSTWFVNQSALAQRLALLSAARAYASGTSIMHSPAAVSEWLTVRANGVTR